MSVCLCVCVSVCLFKSDALATSLHRMPPIFIHALKIFRGRFLSQCRSARLIERALSEGPLFVAAMASCTTAEHHCLAKHKLVTPLASANTKHAKSQLLKSQHAAAAKPVPGVQTRSAGKRELYIQHVQCIFMLTFSF